MKKILNYSELLENEKTNNLLEEIYNLTKKLEKDYPAHYDWYHNKFIKELDGIKREIIFCKLNNEVVAVSLLKKSESKICTIMVDPNYRKMGIGTALMEASFKFLGTTKPFITMPEYKKECFKYYIKKYHWNLNQTIESCYSDNNELVYNGYLKK